MLLIFRLFFFAIGLAVLAVALLARGLVPEPAFHTRIGEVPSLSRPLMQKSIIVPTEWERDFIVSVSTPAEEPHGPPEPTKLAEIAPPVPAATRTPAADTGADETSRTAYVSPVIWSWTPRSDPLTELIRAARAETPKLTLPLRQIADGTDRPASGEPPALAFGVDEPTGVDRDGASSARNGAEASKPTAAKRQAKVETGAEATTEAKVDAKVETGAEATATAETKVDAKAETGAEATATAETKAGAKAEKEAIAAVSPSAKASKPEARPKSVRHDRRTRASKRKAAARSSVRSRRSKTKRTRASQRAKRRAVRRSANSPVATRPTYTYVRQHPDSIYRYERPRYYRYYLVPQYRTNRTYTR